MQLDSLPRPIADLILAYKAQFDKVLQFQAFYNHVMQNLLFF